MDSGSRSNYRSLLKEDWVKLGYQPKHDPLTGTIHPLFQRTNASRPKTAAHIWPQYESEAKYGKMCAIMGPVLQLASNILESQSSLEFLYQVAYSPRVTSDGEISSQGRPCKEFGWNEPPTKAMGRQMAREALRHLSHSLTFLVEDPEADSDLSKSFAVTQSTMLGFYEGVKINDVTDRPGIASRITLNKAKVAMLMELDGQEGDATSQKMSLQLKIAITLCHEITVSTPLESSRLASGPPEILSIALDSISPSI